MAAAARTRMEKGADEKLQLPDAAFAESCAESSSTEYYGFFPRLTGFSASTL